MADFIQQGFYISAALLVVCLALAWLWPRGDTE
jgi:hypothetical protein